ncbi:CoA pyrophosphatase [Frankia sp. AgB1.9]|uniref:NUDIX hydrolase n=1 Tax=unclassified Frankia TaxID=2632575 RepID=UPI0019315F85|nr:MULTISPECIES: CoA pyrophosphatase [unclassified Frankia]MBL7493026.1 CoA pyrophosphatase [Frankia sp. AgW1.1]MBL7552295.1 CoA pyrophosphatase [Frankia sp. AgB1.9]MBL7622048.1 CoA pyrophosphatase [Frankia sp. AgB1.8]
MTGPDGGPDSTEQPAGEPDGPPGWLTAVVATVADGGLSFHPEDWPGPPAHARPAAVLILFGAGERGTEVLLLERSADLRKHAGQPAFPGGGSDPGDGSPAETALREAREEVGLDPTGVDILGVGPPLYVPHSNYLVTPVLAWWRVPSRVFAVDAGETSAVARVPIAELVDPANRVRLSHPRTALPSPAFRVAGLTATVWGFTAGILDALLRLAGLERPWGEGPPVEDATVNASIALSAAQLPEAGAGEIDPADLPVLDLGVPAPASAPGGDPVGTGTGAGSTEEGSAA